jgi:hypothetical protein
LRAAMKRLRSVADGSGGLQGEEEEGSTPASIGSCIPSPFIVQLTAMMADTEIKDGIGWSACGCNIRFGNVSCLAEVMLPKYFKHRSLTTFIRQLNKYGFAVIRQKTRTRGGGDGEGCADDVSDPGRQFHHPLFTRAHVEVRADAGARGAGRGALRVYGRVRRLGPCAMFDWWCNRRRRRFRLRWASFPADDCTPRRGPESGPRTGLQRPCAGT